MTYTYIANLSIYKNRWKITAGLTVPRDHIKFLLEIISFVIYLKIIYMHLTLIPTSYLFCKSELKYSTQFKEKNMEKLALLFTLLARNI